MTYKANGSWGFILKPPPKPKGYIKQGGKDMYIDVKRDNFPERTIRYKNGGTRFVPEHHECRYYHKGREIAYYDSREDCLYLKSDYIDIGSDQKKKPYARALECFYKDAYSYLFGMLGVDETSKVSEYFSL